MTVPSFHLTRYKVQTHMLLDLCPQQIWFLTFSFIRQMFVRTQNPPDTSQDQPYLTPSQHLSLSAFPSFKPFSPLLWHQTLGSPLLLLIPSQALFLCPLSAPQGSDFGPLLSSHSTRSQRETLGILITAKYLIWGKQVPQRGSLALRHYSALVK